MSKQIETLLERKASIDKRNKEVGTNMVSHEFWLVDAVEALLRIELFRQAEAAAIRKGE